ncbi:MAG: hypothetical protein EBU08_06325 [Micrococcales bacterium]|nr:hypothetical protein [Micrococcales bacterium]
MKALLNMLSDVRTSPQAVATELMKEHPDTQEMFILLFVTYIAAMANRSVYHEEVEHLILWSRDVLKALDRIKRKV